MSNVMEYADRQTATPAAGRAVSKAAFWTGWVLTALPSLMLIFSAVMKFAQPPEVAKGFEDLGWPLRLAVALGILEIAVTILYVIPQTAVLGAILVTGYLGGATATHVRIGDPFITTVVLGMVMWLGLYLREPRLRALVPLRR